MTDFECDLNRVLVETFRKVLKVEELMIQKTAKNTLSINEVHLIESVGNRGKSEKSISDIAKDLGVTLPSITIAINKLVKKGYVNKAASAKDKRMVCVKLTKMGEKMNAAHRFFHKSMVSNISHVFSDTEKHTLLTAIEKLNGFFSKKIEGANA